MPRSALGQIFRAHTKDFALVDEFLHLMQKFEVVLILNSDHLLRPALLPVEVLQATFILPLSHSPGMTQMPAPQDRFIPPMCQLPYPIVSRYYLLPFVPNGLFPRLLARIVSSDILEHLQHSLVSSPLESQHVLNAPHFECWRSGVIVVLKLMEIFRIAPSSCPPLGSNCVRVVSSTGSSPVETLKCIEVYTAKLSTHQYIIEYCANVSCALCRMSKQRIGNYFTNFYGVYIVDVR